jgi:hypothetical protein
MKPPVPPLSPELMVLLKNIEQIPRNHVHFVRHEVFAASMAVSLRRIADTLELIAEKLSKLE